MRNGALLPRVNLTGEAPPEELIPVVRSRSGFTGPLLPAFIPSALLSLAAWPRFGALLGMEHSQIPFFAACLLWPVLFVTLSKKLNAGRGPVSIALYVDRWVQRRIWSRIRRMRLSLLAGFVFISASLVIGIMAPQVVQKIGPDRFLAFVGVAVAGSLAGFSMTVKRIIRPRLRRGASSEWAVLEGVSATALERLAEIERAPLPELRSVLAYQAFPFKYPLRSLINRTWLNPAAALTMLIRIALARNTPFFLFHHTAKEEIPFDRLPEELAALARPWLRTKNDGGAWLPCEASRLETPSGHSINEAASLISPDGRSLLIINLTTVGSDGSFAQLKAWKFFSQLQNGALLRTAAEALLTPVPGVEDRKGPGDPQACLRAHLRHLGNRTALALTPGEWRERIGAQDDATLAALIAAGLATQPVKTLLPVR